MIRPAVSKPLSLVALLFVAALLGGCREKASQAHDAQPAAKPDGPKTVKFDPKSLERLGIKVEVAGSNSGTLDLEVPGSLEYNLDHYAEVGTLVDGRLTAITVKPGDPVKKGQLLAQLVVPSIANAQAEYLSANAADKSAKTNLDRETNLLEKGLTTAREAEVAKAEAARAEADLAAAKAKLDALGVGRPTAGASISGAGVLTLTAPIDGVVVRRDAVLGRFLQAKETAFVIADPADLRAALNVYEADLPYFHVGQEAEVFVDALPGKSFKGQIILVEPQIGRQSRSARAYINVDNKDGFLKPGLFIRASIKLPEAVAQGRLLIAAPAVQPIGDEKVVFVEQKEPGSFEVRKVQVARTTTQVAEIREGLQKGERIAVEGAFVLRGEVTKQ
ncbi:MAG: efflux RND transporter periplasmic adaptor subunit [Labilithrix sp.]|nr:efflux RND transporter periplasmic adaptor subunit [Labilithrix sp.]MCW5810023.1 efflux RND transporter periplasmic adaptor subunit [Labilithrix sp.]